MDIYKLCVLCAPARPAGGYVVKNTIMKNILIILFSIFSLSLSAQGISGKTRPNEVVGQAYYQSKTSTGADYSSMPEEKRLRLEKREEMLYEKNYILTFNNNESSFKEEEKLSGPSKGMSAYMLGTMHTMMAYTTESIYKNLAQQKIIEQREFIGKRFLIKDTLPKLDWQLEKETKNIGGYTVFKATTIIKINRNDYRVNVILDQDSTAIGKMGNMIVTAWYTPQIPISNGPEEYSGLPGLILELYVGKTTYLCSKIVLNSKKEQAITPPKIGEIVTYQEFDKIAAEKKKEMPDFNKY